MKIYHTLKLIGLFIGLFFYTRGYAQEEKGTPVEYKVIAEGTDSPIPLLQIVCYNKYFNLDYLPESFRKKYQLNEKSLYKKKMLVELFYADKKKEGLDKIELIGITESESKLVVEYKVINSTTTNDDKKLSPFLIVQVPKSKKEIKFVVNGLKQGKATKLYVD